MKTANACSQLQNLNSMIPYLKSHCWCPAKLLFDQCVIRVATANSFWAGNVMNGEFLILKAEYHFRHLIHAHHLITSNVHWFAKVWFCQSIKENKLCYSHIILNGRAIYYVVPQYTFNTFIDESERPSLQSISPHFKLISRSDSLSTKCSRGLFPPACIINHSRVIKGSSW